MCRLLCSVVPHATEQRCVVSHATEQRCVACYRAAFVTEQTCGVVSVAWRFGRLLSSLLSSVLRVCIRQYCALRSLRDDERDTAQQQESLSTGSMQSEFTRARAPTRGPGRAKGGASPARPQPGHAGEKPPPRPRPGQGGEAGPPHGPSRATWTTGGQPRVGRAATQWKAGRRTPGVVTVAGCAGQQVRRARRLQVVVGQRPKSCSRAGTEVNKGSEALKEAHPP